MKITLKSKSSSGEPYDVDFLLAVGKLQAHCNCNAGVMGMLCKHRRALLAGDSQMLSDPSQAKDLATVVQWASQSNLPSLLQRLDAAEKEVSQAQREVKKLKSILLDAMDNGLNCTL